MNKKDDKFYRTLYDKEGNPVRILKEQLGVDARQKDNNGFTTYDGSHGHCCLCGSLTCRGGCFK